MVKLGLAYGFALAVASVIAAPKAIKSGWDTSGLTPEQILAKADAFDALPFDGFAFALNEPGKDEHTGYRRVSCGHLWSREHLKRYIPVFRELVKHKTFKESFGTYYFLPTKRIDWTDDAAWRTFGENLATAAWLAKQGGLKGLILDSEDYWRSFQLCLRPEDGMTFDEAAKLARRRGADVFRRAFEEYPDITILTYWWLSRNYGYIGSQDPIASMRGDGDLMVPFTEGILDVMPMTVRFYDGNEHTYHWPFVRAYADLHVYCPDVISPENRQKFRACFGLAPAFYLDMYTNREGASWYRGPTGGRRLNTFLDRYEDATMFSDGYIWLFGEKHACIDWGDVGYADSRAVAYTNGTWDAALPGFNEELAILKNPRGELLPRLRALKESGRAENLVSALTPDGKAFRAAVKGVRYGEWYAVLVEAKSVAPTAGCGLKCGNYSIWTRPTAKVVFEEPKADGVRRGIAFQRIWGDADTLTVGVEPRRGKLEDVKVSIYRVFAPSEK